MEVHLLIGLLETRELVGQTQHDASSPPSLCNGCIFRLLCRRSSVVVQLVEVCRPLCQFGKGERSANWWNGLDLLPGPVCQISLFTPRLLSFFRSFLLVRLGELANQIMKINTLSGKGKTQFSYTVLKIIQICCLDTFWYNSIFLVHSRAHHSDINNMFLSFKEHNCIIVVTSKNSLNYKCHV